MKSRFRRLLIFAGALAFVLSNAFSLAQETHLSWTDKIVLFLAIATAIGSHFLSLFGIGLLMQQRFPGLSNTRKRIGSSLAYGIPAVGLLITVTDYWQVYLRNETHAPFSWIVAFATLFQGAAIAIFVIGTMEAIYHYEQLLKAERDKEELERLHLLAQYDSLKQQINPHFLFNSLNSLSSLISLDPPKAEMFVEEMSSVYRYLLQSSREELTTIGAEINFLGSYLHLLKTRFGKALLVNIDVPDTWHRHRIPPLTLQLLLENAVKHNEISADRPLSFHIAVSADGRLRVSNPVQLKMVSVPSEKIGLANIMARYRLLGQPEVIVETPGNEFVVIIPLIPPDEV